MISRNSTALQRSPKYYQIYVNLLEGIRDNTWGHGSTLPSEAELCKRYNASRGTVRRALDELERHGLIERESGRSTRVTTPKIPLLASGFRTDIANKGLKAGTTILKLETGPTPPEVATLLHANVDDEVLVIQRLISADNLPIVVESVYVPYPVDPISESDIELLSLLELIPTKRRVILSKSVESYEPVNLTTEQTRLLHVKDGHLAIRAQALVLDIELNPIYVSIALVRGDKATIVTETVFSLNQP